MAFFLTISLLTGLVPMISRAATNELVLTQIGHNKADSVVISDSSTRAVTLTLPYSYSGSTVDLSDGGLRIEKASTIGPVVTIFESGSTATIGTPGSPGPAVVMTVKYYKGSDTTTQYTTLYSISIVRTAKKDPSFSGTVVKSVTGVMPNTAVKDITFSANDFTTLYKANDGASLSKISISGNSLACGALKIATGGDTYVNYNAGDMLDIAGMENLVFDAVGGGSVSYLVNAYTSTNTTTAIGSVLLNIDVKDIATPTLNVNSTVAKSVNIGTSAIFTMSDFSSLCSLNDGALKSIEITPANSGFGVWSNGSSQFTTATTFTAATISNLKFTGSATGTAAFTWKISNEAGFSLPGNGTITVKQVTVPTITASVTKSVGVGSTYTFSMSDFSSCYNLNNGTFANIVISPTNSSYGTWYKGSSPFYSTASFTANDITSLQFRGTQTGQATFTWTVSNEKGAASAGSGSIAVAPTASAINYTTAQNTAKTFALADFNTACYNATSGTLSYVIFTSMSSSSGSLYYGYTSPSSPGTAISWNSSYTTQYLSAITFVPSSNFTGTVTITYTGVTTGGISFTSSVKITVGSTADINYTTAQNVPKTLSISDFTSACSYATSGGTLSYVYFTAVSPSSAALYYGYSSASSPGTSVTSLTQVAASYLSSITLVPTANYTGTVTITYTGVTTANISYTGSVKITVGGSANVTYSTALNTPKTFSAADFNTAVSNITSGGALSYLYFSQVTDSNGALYYGYTSASTPGTAISSSSQLFATNLSGITFVPALNYTGSVTITYTGVTTGGTSFSGSVKITVGSSGTVSYTTTKNTAKTFSATDFNTAFSNATGLSLSFIILDPPTSTYGTLNANYASSSSPGNPITTSTVFYVSGTPTISTVTFVPASNYTGTVTLPYTGFSTSGVQYQGSVVINITGPASDISFTLKNNQTIKFSSTDINTVCKTATGAALKYITFILPYTTYGKLYYNYTSTASPGTAVTATTAYYADTTPDLDNVTFVPATTYTGNVIITYTGYNVNGVSYTGRFNIQINKSTGSSHFTDVGQSYDWAASAIDYLFDAGIVKGTGGTLYNPTANMTRGDFILMLYRATGYKGSTSTNFSDVPKGSYYYDALAAAKALGIAVGTNNKINPTSLVTRQDAMLFTYRALLLTGKTLTTGSSSDISGFTDKGSIGSYALTAVETLVKAGIIKGTGSKLNPTGTLSRAEVAVVMYRVKTTY